MQSSRKARDEDEGEEDEDIGELKRIPTRTASTEKRERFAEEEKEDDDTEDDGDDEEDVEDEDEIYLQDRKNSRVTHSRDRFNSKFVHNPSRDHLLSPRDLPVLLHSPEVEKRDGGFDPFQRDEENYNIDLFDSFDIYFSFPHSTKILSIMEKLKNHFLEIIPIVGGNGCRIYYDDLGQHINTFDETSYQALQSSRCVLIPMTIEFWKEYHLRNMKSRLWIELLTSLFIHSSSLIFPVIFDEGSYIEISSFLQMNHLLENDIIAKQLWDNVFYFYAKNDDHVVPSALGSNVSSDILSLFFHKRCEDLLLLIAKRIHLYPFAHSFLSSSSANNDKDFLFPSNNQFTSLMKKHRFYTYWNTILTLPDYYFMIQQVQVKMMDVLDQVKHIIRESLLRRRTKAHSDDDSLFTSEEKFEIAKLLSPLQISLSHDIYNPYDWLNWSKMLVPNEVLVQHSLVKFCMKYKFFLYFFILLHIQQLIVDLLLLVADPSYHYLHHITLSQTPTTPALDHKGTEERKSPSLQRSQRPSLEAVLSLCYGIFPEFHSLFPFHVFFPANPKSLVRQEEVIVVKLPSLENFSRHSLPAFFFKSYVVNLALTVTNSAGVQLSYQTTFQKFPHYLLNYGNPLQKIQHMTKVMNEIEIRRLRVLYLSFHSTDSASLMSIRATLTTRALSTASNPSMYGMTSPVMNNIMSGRFEERPSLSAKSSHSMNYVTYTDHEENINDNDLHLGDILMTIIYKFLKILNKQLEKWKFYLSYSNIYLFQYYYESFLLPYYQDTRELLQEWEKMEINYINNMTKGGGSGGGISGNNNSNNNSYNHSYNSNSFNVSDLTSSYYSAGSLGGGGGLTSTSSGVKYRAGSSTSTTPKGSFSLNLSGGSNNHHHHPQHFHHQLALIRISQNLKKIKHKHKLLIILISQLKSIFINSFQESMMNLERKKYEFDDGLLHIITPHKPLQGKQQRKIKTKDVVTRASSSNFPGVIEYPSEEVLQSLLLDLAYEIKKEYRTLYTNIDRKKSRITIKMLKNQLTNADEDIRIIMDDWQSIMENFPKIIYVKKYFYQKKVYMRCSRLIQSFFYYFHTIIPQGLKQEKNAGGRERSRSEGHVGGEENVHRLSELSNHSGGGVRPSYAMQTIATPTSPPPYSLMKSPVSNPAHYNEQKMLMSPVASNHDRHSLLTPPPNHTRQRTFSTGSHRSHSRSNNKRGNKTHSTGLITSIPIIDSLLPKSSYKYTSILWNTEKYFIYYLQQIPLQNLYIYECFRRYFSILYNVYEIRYFFYTPQQRMKIYETCQSSIQDLYFYERQLKKRRLVNLDWNNEIFPMKQLIRLIEITMNYWMRKLELLPVSSSNTSNN